MNANNESTLSERNKTLRTERRIMSIPKFDEILQSNDQTEARSASLEAIAGLVGNVYPNRFDRSAVSGAEDTITALKQFGKIADVEAKMSEIKAKLGEGQRPAPEDKEPLNEELRALGTVRIAGRLTTPTRGNFVHLTDGMSKLQVYCNKKGPLALIKNDGSNTLDEANGWALWQLLDHGDFIGVEGYLFVTNTGEVSVHVEKLQFLAKAMLPMPDKMHGIADAEIRQRQRYVDLIGSSLQVRSEPPASAGGQLAEQGSTAWEPELTTREVFERRAKVISSLRRFLEDHGYIEVETPMLTPKATGAAAKPFKTHHNALDIDLYARIAPELYLKRLVVGGFEKVYELNRNFRNEGISYKHNPEFTMLEFYCAYMDVEGMIGLCKRLLDACFRSALARSKDQGLEIVYQHKGLDLGSIECLSMHDAVGRVFRGIIPTFEERWLDDVAKLPALVDVAKEYSIRSKYLMSKTVDNKEYVISANHGEISGLELDGWKGLPDQDNRFYDDDAYGTELYVQRLAEHTGKLSSNPGVDLAEIFESVAEHQLLNPTFIVDYPKSMSPLSKASPDNPAIAERFELFINGMEIANGFSELNDPKEQYERFKDQMEQREGGDEEAMVLDEDYIRALSYGMPPAAGIGIGIDRLVMLLTDKHSIRDVILFPHMRPESEN